MLQRLLGLACCLVLVLLPDSAGAAAATDGQATEQQVLAALNVDRIHADYVVLIDTSGSMQQGNLYQGVQAALRPLLDSLSPNDFLSLMTFDTAPELYFDGPIGSAGATVENRLPATATGQHTDIGQAIQTGIDQLGRPDANQIGTLILLTDGQHDPGPNSAYPATTGPAWTALATQARALSAEHAINAFALALRSNTDASLLKSVFSQATVVDLPPVQMAGYLDNLKNSVGELKARALLSADTPTVSAAWSAAAATTDRTTDDVTLTLHSNARYVPLVVTGAQLHATHADFDVSALPADIVLKPGQSRTFPVHLASDSGGGFGFGQHTTSQHGEVTMTGQVSSPWSQVISDRLHLSPRYRLTTEPEPASFTSTTGWSYLTFVLLVLAVAVVLILVRGYRVSRQPRLRGQLLVMHGAEQIEELSLRGRKMTFRRGAAVQGKLQGAQRRDPIERNSENGVRVRFSSPARVAGTLWPGDQIEVGTDMHVIYQN